MSAVELQNVSKAFGQTKAVDELSLAVPKGSIYGFIGPNGSGKTTTLRMIMNIFYPDCGSIHILGGEMHRASTDRIGYLPEERGLYRRMKVREVLRFFGALKAGRPVDGEVDRWLEKFGLSQCANQRVETLSKGMSQKVQFIAAVVFGPELLILDEPFSGLDPVNVEVVRAAVLELRTQGATVILSTHDMSVAETMCDFIFMIFRGRKVLDGTLTSIQDQYGTDTIRVRVEGGLAVLQGLPGVEAVRDFGQVQELRMARDCDPQAVLATLLARTRVRSFEIAKPSLHDIFVRIAGPQDTEASHA
ncbi:MAG: ATP-binding cassette domain-containing protein [Verrucomicrobia bacterium]|nr:ATP-binding cassette domain-containing protein [Verrucomicrobiota bacterium]